MSWKLGIGEASSICSISVQGTIDKIEKHNIYELGFRKETVISEMWNLQQFYGFQPPSHEPRFSLKCSQWVSSMPAISGYLNCHKQNWKRNRQMKNLRTCSKKVWAEPEEWFLKLSCCTSISFVPTWLHVFSILSGESSCSLLPSNLGVTRMMHARFIGHEPWKNESSSISRWNAMEYHGVPDFPGEATEAGPASGRAHWRWTGENWTVFIWRRFFCYQISNWQTLGDPISACFQC